MILTDGVSYNYANGATTTSFNNSFQTWQHRVINIRGLPDFTLISFANRLITYSVAGTGFLSHDTFLNQANPYNSSYYFRTGVNPLLQEAYIVSLSNTVMSIKANLISGVFTSNTTDANYLGSQFLFAEAYVMTSNIGTSSTHMAFAYFEPRPSSTVAYPHKLVIHTRGLASLVTI
jgi:hypothetical protein